MFALAIPWPGKAINSVKVGDFKVFQTIEIIIIFIITGLTLRTKEIYDALKAWFPFIVGAVTILIITPCAAFALVALPFSPRAYSYGLAIFALVPTTIASGITLVSVSQGNTALAVMLTVVTNILAVFTVPFTIQLVITDANTINLNPVDLLIKLIVTILVPVIVGKVISSIFSVVAKFVAKHKVALGLINNFSLILIVWQTMSSAQDDIVNTAFSTLVLVALAAILLHVAYLIGNYALVKLLCMPSAEGKAVLIMGSEKTLPMAVTVIAYLPASLGKSGQLTVPCVIAHISQVLMDAALAQRMGRKALEQKDMEIESMDSNGRALNSAENGATRPQDLPSANVSTASDVSKNTNADQATSSLECVASNNPK